MFQIDLASRIPIYEQLVQNVIKLASAGVIKSGYKLPPVRTLASQLSINPNTVAKAYSILETKGYVASIVGSGSFLTEKLETSAQQVIALDNFTQATKTACLYGTDKNELIEIINRIFEGGEKVD